MARHLRTDAEDRLRLVVRCAVDGRQMALNAQAGEPCDAERTEVANFFGAA
ncbi:hypothetical protein D3C72_2490360 [compost metagenome]